MTVSIVLIVLLALLLACCIGGALCLIKYQQVQVGPWAFYLTSKAATAQTPSELSQGKRGYASRVQPAVEC